MCMQASGCQHKTALSPFLICTSSWIGYVSTRPFTFELSWYLHRCQHQTKTELARFQNIRQSISMKATDYHGLIMLSSLFWPKQWAMRSYKVFLWFVHLYLSRPIECISALSWNDHARAKSAQQSQFLLVSEKRAIPIHASSTLGGLIVYRTQDTSFEAEKRLLRNFEPVLCV